MPWIVAAPSKTVGSATGGSGTVAELAQGALLPWFLPTKIKHTKQTNQMKIEVRYQTPYGECEWRSQWFPTLDEAERMVDFYRSCGSPSHVAPSSLAQFAHLS